MRRVSKIAVLTIVPIAAILGVQVAAHASDGPVCGSSSNGMETICFSITGAGLEVNSMQGTVWTANSLPNVHVEITYPNGSALKNFATGTHAAGTTSYSTGTLDVDVPQGNYTAILWQYSGGSYHDLAQIALPVG